MLNGRAAAEDVEVSTVLCSTSWFVWSGYALSQHRARQPLATHGSRATCNMAIFLQLSGSRWNYHYISLQWLGWSSGGLRGINSIDQNYASITCSLLLKIAAPQVKSGTRPRRQYFNFDLPRTASSYQGERNWGGWCCLWARLLIALCGVLGLGQLSYIRIHWTTWYRNDCSTPIMWQLRNN